MDALKHDLNIFSGPYLPSEEVPQGVCGSSTSCISDLRPHCPVDPATQGRVSLPSAVSLQRFPTPYACVMLLVLKPQTSLPCGS